MNNPEQTAKVKPTALFPMVLEDLSESCQAVRYFPTIRRLSYGSSIVVQNVGKLRPRSRQISVVVRPSVMNPRKCLEIKMTVVAKLGLCLVTINPGFSVHKCPNSSPNEDTLSTAAAVWTRRTPAPSAGTRTGGRIRRKRSHQSRVLPGAAKSRRRTASRLAPHWTRSSPRRIACHGCTQWEVEFCPARKTQFRDSLSARRETL